MVKFANGLRGHGYDQEEAYFHKLDQQLIEKHRQRNRASPDLKLIQGGKTATSETDSEPTGKYLKDKKGA